MAIGSIYGDRSQIEPAQVEFRLMELTQLTEKKRKIWPLENPLSQLQF
jgi:hypothetical protein